MVVATAAAVSVAAAVGASGSKGRTAPRTPALAGTWHHYPPLRGKAMETTLLLQPLVVGIIPLRAWCGGVAVVTAAPPGSAVVAVVVKEKQSFPRALCVSTVWTPRFPEYHP